MFRHHTVLESPLSRIDTVQSPGLKEDPEVPAHTKRRRLTVAFKLTVLEPVQTLKSQGHGAVGAYLRKERLYYSAVRTWERLQAEGKLTSSYSLRRMPYLVRDNPSMVASLMQGNSLPKVRWKHSSLPD